MANSTNIVILCGNLCKDPELRYGPRGGAVCEFSIALNRSWNDQATGEKKEEVTFVDCVAFGKSAEAIAQHLRKGNPILVQARLKTETWDDKQTGQKRSKLKVLVDSFQFVGGREQQQSSTPPRGNPAPRKSAPVDRDEEPPPF